MSPDRATMLRAYAGARWGGPRTRAALERRHAVLWSRLAPVLARALAFRHLAGQPLANFPVVDPAEVRATFEARNTLGLSRQAAEAAADDAEAGGEGLVAPGVVAGWSTGSGGARGLFLSSRRERALYIGHALARLMPPGAVWRRWRIALCLRADNRLYRDVAGTGRIQIRFFGLDIPAMERRRALHDWRPDVLIAPSHVLADLSRQVEAGAPSLAPVRLFYGAEPMGEAERAWIGATLGARADPIYQATEGFLGAPCRLGALHLNEDVLVIEREPIAGTTRFAPVVTDLRRTTQPMIRVRLSDLLEETACACGSPCLTVHGVEGRVEDLWRWPGVAIAPRAVDEALSPTLGPDRDWRALASPAGVELQVEDQDAAIGRAALERLLGGAAPVRVTPLIPQAGPKRRRVRWSDD